MRTENLISAAEIASRVSEVAEKLRADYADKGKEPLFLIVLNGAFIFAADLIRAYGRPCTVDSVGVKSYLSDTAGGELEDALKSGDVVFTKQPNDDVRGKDVVLVEDIFDTGKTLFALVSELKSRRPASLRLCLFADKDVSRQGGLKPDYLCFNLPDKFIVGYGLDAGGMYRYLTGLSAIES